MKRQFPVMLIAVVTSCLFTKIVTAQIHEFKKIVKNGIRPSDQANQILSLDHTLSIDMERQDLMSAGMGIPAEFDVDAKGNIYVVAFRSKKNFIYKFDSAGKFLHAFGEFGQGPGELQWPFRPKIAEGNILTLFDGQKRTFSVFDEYGKCREEKLLPWASSVEPLPNGKYLVKSFIDEFATKESYVLGLYLYDRQFRKLKELDRRMYSTDDSQLVPYFMWRSTPKYIYVVNENRGYEIWVFDLDGNPVRKITKEFKPVRVTDELIELFIKPYETNSRPAIDRFFPKPMPPMNQIFVDDEDRVYVITYERGESKGEYMIDIFDSDGVLISRKSLNLLWARLYQGPHFTFAKDGKLYFYREKENGYYILTRHEMRWKREVSQRNFLSNLSK